MKNKIAIIIERAKVALGGAERSVLELAAALSGLGQEVDILAAKGRTDADNVHILCPNQPDRRVRYFTFEKAVKKHLSRKSYDIIHSALPFEFADVYQPRGGAYAESILRNAASYENRFVEFFKKYAAFTNWRRTVLLHAERKLSQRSDGPVIAALSRYVAEQFKQRYGTDEQRIVIISNGVKTNRPISADSADKLRTQILANLRIKESEHPVLFLFVANNFRLKGLAPLIRAMSVAAQLGAPRKGYLVVVGSGKKLKYTELAEKFRLPSMGRRIVFLGAVSQVQNILSTVDVAVLPTFYDPSSRFILEALAAGKPVITTRFNGATDLFVNERHGMVVDTPRDVNALAEALNYFTDTGNIERASKAIRKDNLEKNVSVSRAAGELMELYRTILHKKGRQ
ncbi:MAG: glycosyltransferase family 4 protein [Phycisphaerales bacterium]|nr:MAG: glycosyltransferase family 4 protein [Phycisphaerales bacterium]